jgi:hypothetical protein
VTIVCIHLLLETSQLLLGNIETAMLAKQFHDAIAAPIGWELSKERLSQHSATGMKSLVGGRQERLLVVSWYACVTCCLDPY